MGAQLNIKSDEAYRLASSLAEMTGESLTTVVTRALQSEFEREEKSRSRERRLAELREITADIRRAMGDNAPTSDHGWLYDDETGLPK